MKVDVTFVNFPSSDSAKEVIVGKIEQHVSKYYNRETIARLVCFSEGNRQYVKLSLAGGNINLTVSSSSLDASRALDKAIDKLDALLRRTIARKKYHYRTEHKHSNAMSKWMLKRDNSNTPVDNVFDKFENEFVEEFEYAFDKAV